MLPSQILESYTETFFGFGNWKCKVWFIGIEEAGGYKEQEIAERLKAWDANGRKELENAPTFYPKCGNIYWHGEKASPQATWRQLIRMLLLARGKPDFEDDLLKYQRTRWGTSSGDTCLIELLPLPSPGTTEWNYPQWSKVRWLKDRAAYIAKVRAGRENEIRRRIKMHNPKVVIFYGLNLSDKVSLIPSWTSIACGTFSQAFNHEKKLLWRTEANTTFFVTYHPVAQDDAYFQEIGNFFNEHHGSLF